MSSQAVRLQAEKRDIIGKKVSKLRRQGKIPAVIYERGKDSEHIMADALALQKVWQGAGKHHVIELSVDSASWLVLIKDVDTDPVKGFLTHVAFHAVNQKEKVEAEIPVVITGDIPAEHKSLFLVRPIDTLVVKALPTELPDKIEISGESLIEVGDMIRVEDIKLPTNIEILTELDGIVAMVEEPRAVVEEEAEETEEEAAEVPSEHGASETEKPTENNSQD